MVARRECRGSESRSVGAPLHLRQVPGRRIPAAPEPRDHHRPLVRSRHGAGRGHGVAQAREDHHRRQGRSRIQDLGSTNGTFVNGEKIRKVELKDGDRILIGTSIIKLVSVDGEHTNHLTETEARSKMAVAGQQDAAPRQVDVGQHRGDPAARPAAAAVDQPQVRRAGRALRRRRRQDLPAQGADLLRQHRRQLQHRPAQGASSAC